MSTHATRTSAIASGAIHTGQSAGAGERSSDKSSTASRTQVQVTRPSQRYGGCFRRESRSGTSRRPSQKASETTTVGFSTDPSASSQAGIKGSLHARPVCVNGQVHSPVSSLQLPCTEQPTAQREWAVGAAVGAESVFVVPRLGLMEVRRVELKPLGLPPASCELSSTSRPY